MNRCVANCLFQWKISNSPHTCDVCSTDPEARSYLRVKSAALRYCLSSLGVGTLHWRVGRCMRRPFRTSRVVYGGASVA